MAKVENGADARDQEILALKVELEERTLTIGGLAATNHILKKLSGQSKRRTSYVST